VSNVSHPALPVQQANPAPRPVTSGRRAGTSAAERKRQQRARERAERAQPTELVYETADWKLFTDRETLPQKAGCQPKDIRKVVLKELVDNALDAGARVSLDLVDGVWVAADDGPGIDPALVPELFAVNRPLRSSKLRRMPLRGMLGNGLRVVVGAVVAFDGSLVVETRGHRLTLTVCPLTGQTMVALDEAMPVVPGTTVRIGFGWNDPQVASLARSSIVLAEDTKPYTGHSCPWWYGRKDLHRLFTNVTPEDTTVSDVCRSLGLDYDDSRPARSLGPDDTADVLKSLRVKYEPVQPDELGFFGKGVRFRYTQTDGVVAYAGKSGIHNNQAGASIPYIIEAWVVCERSDVRGSRSAEIGLFLNRSKTVSAIHAKSADSDIGILGCGLDFPISDIGPGYYTVILSIITPYVQLAGDGKEPVLTPFEGVIAQLLRKACSAAHRQMEKPPGSLSFKDAAWQVMPDAYKVASNNGKLPANARQIMYAARPQILQLTGKDKLPDVYFTQTLLPDYVSANGLENEWDVVYDARGTFSEPHTDREVRLGTIDVRTYLGDRAPLDPVVDVSGRDSYPTNGPQNRYRAVLYIEKEGFAPLLQAARIAERFDIAIMSSKGMSTTAARLLLDRLAPDIDKVLVLHDFDVSGFSIFGTLHTDGRRYSFKNNLPIVDIGLRLADVEMLELQSEPVETSGDWKTRIKTLKSHGATGDEIRFLQNRRVELNAMPSNIFVAFLERKLQQNGVRKLVPDQTTLELHARRMLEQKLIEAMLSERSKEFRDLAAKAILPDDLAAQVAELLRQRPEMAWDQAVSAIVQR
jgi:hypothetical protein